MVIVTLSPGSAVPHTGARIPRCNTIPVLNKAGLEKRTSARTAYGATQMSTAKTLARRDETFMNARAPAVQGQIGTGPPRVTPRRAELTKVDCWPGQAPLSTTIRGACA